jgi:DNA-directed RNA polymerase subunit L
MDIEINEQTDNKIIFKIDEDDTFCNLLKDSLYTVKGVKIATYHIKHPLIKKTTFILETEGVKPKDALKKGVDKTIKRLDEFKKNFLKEI